MVLLLISLLLTQHQKAGVFVSDKFVMMVQSFRNMKDPILVEHLALLASIRQDPKACRKKHSSLFCLISNDDKIKTGVYVGLMFFRGAHNLTRKNKTDKNTCSEQTF